MTISLISLSLGNQAFAQSEKLVVLETNLGTIVIEFFPEDAPNHVENFISLTESGFYDGTIFHRIIPGFMIQGGDPNTIDGDQSTWGIGGPEERVNAEFNTIKHNRGIVSMARSADPDSGGSQFFIVHQNSNFLDEQYSVFGRIVTDESFETLDKITAVETGPRDIPIETEQVKIVKASVVDRSDVSNLLNLPEPERTLTITEEQMDDQKFESTKHEVILTAPAGWLLQEPDEKQENSPDILMVGPLVGSMNPFISFTATQTNDRSFDDFIFDKNMDIKPMVDSGNLKILLQKKTTINGNQAYETNAQGIYNINGENLNVKFKEVAIYTSEKIYTLSYANEISQFDSQLPKFEETLNTFEMLSEDSNNTITTEEGGGCLIATATFGSELAPQVQQLRELRDNTILATNSGSAFMSGFNQLYYSFSPTIADLEREHPVFKEFVKLSITPMLASLSILNHVDIDSEQEMLSYGIGIIMMNLGMYFAAPAIIIYKIRKL